MGVMVRFPVKLMGGVVLAGLNQYLAEVLLLPGRTFISWISSPRGISILAVLKGITGSQV